MSLTDTLKKILGQGPFDNDYLDLARTEAADLEAELADQRNKKLEAMEHEQLLREQLTRCRERERQLREALQRRVWLCDGVPVLSESEVLAILDKEPQ